MARMTRITVPDTATPEEVWEALRVNIDGQATDPSGAVMTEGKALTYVQNNLAYLGYAKQPEVRTGKVDGLTCRMYIFRQTRVGDIVLLAGPQAIPRLIKWADLQKTPQAGEIYTLASAGGGSMAKQAAATAERLQRVGQAQDRVARTATPPSEPRPAPAPRAAARPPRAPRATSPSPPPPSSPSTGRAGELSAADAAALERGVKELGDIFK